MTGTRAERDRRRRKLEKRRFAGELHLTTLYNPPLGNWGGYLTITGAAPASTTLTQTRLASLADVSTFGVLRSRGRAQAFGQGLGRHLGPVHRALAQRPALPDPQDHPLARAHLERGTCTFGCLACSVLDHIATGLTTSRRHDVRRFITTSRPSRSRASSWRSTCMTGTSSAGRTRSATPAFMSTSSPRASATCGSRSSRPRPRKTTSTSASPAFFFSQMTCCWHC